MVCRYTSDKQVQQVTIRKVFLGDKWVFESKTTSYEKNKKSKNEHIGQLSKEHFFVRPFAIKYISAYILSI